MKILKWVIGVPVGIFVLMVILEMRKQSGSTPNVMGEALADCNREVRSLYVGGDKLKAVQLQQKCDSMPRR